MWIAQVSTSAEADSNPRSLFLTNRLPRILSTGSPSWIQLKSTWGDLPWSNFRIWLTHLHKPWSLVLLLQCLPATLTCGQGSVWVSALYHKMMWLSKIHFSGFLSSVQRGEQNHLCWLILTILTWTPGIIPVPPPPPTSGPGKEGAPRLSTCGSNQTSSAFFSASTKENLGAMID